MNEAARIEAVATNGRILASEDLVERLEPEVERLEPEDVAEI